MGQKSRSKKQQPPVFRNPERNENSAAAGNRERGDLPNASLTKNWLFAIALVAAVFLAYQPAWHGGFIFDDDLHLLNNPVLKTGGLARIWVPGNYVAYWPLTFTVYRLEFEAWGLDPLGYHLVNITLHAAIALFVWRVLVELDVRGAMLAAAVFALHPVNVESVAWIAQLKGLLSLLFALISTLFYLQYDRRGGLWRYVAAIAAFGLSTLAKGMVITLPVVLLACVWWRRDSIKRRDLVRIIPYVLIGAAMACVEISMQRAGDAVRSDSMLSRAAVAGCAVWFYLGNLLWPFNLCFIYPHWKIDDGEALSYLPGLLLLVMLFALALRQRRTWGRPLVMLIICYVALLLPALGFANIAYMRYSLVADHWQYAATIVPCAVLTGVAGAWMFKHPGHRAAARVLSLSLLAVLAVLARWQSGMYADKELIYRTTIEMNPDCWLAHLNLGIALAERQQVDEAVVHYQTALRINPESAGAHVNLGAILADRGRADEAMVHFQKALKIDPGSAEVHNNLGKALKEPEEIEEAISHFRIALKIKPDYAEAHYNLARALSSQAKFDEAIYHYQKALEYKPDSIEALINLGAALSGREQLDEAIVCFRKAVEIKPDSARAHYTLGLALANSERPREALEHFHKALDLALAENDSNMAERIRAKIGGLRR